MVIIRNSGLPPGARPALLFLLLLVCSVDLGLSADVDITEDADDAFDEGFDESISSNTTTASLSISAPPPKEGSIADMIDRALEKEFSEKEQHGGMLIFH